VMLMRHKIAFTMQINLVKNKILFNNIKCFISLQRFELLHKFEIFLKCLLVDCDKLSIKGGSTPQKSKFLSAKFNETY